MLWDWLNSRRPRVAAGLSLRLPEWNVVMYTRQGCHLCEQAWQQLEQAQQQYHFALHQIDVDADAELVREYGECVPVVVVNGRVRFRGVINPVLLKRLLEANRQR